MITLVTALPLWAAQVFPATTNRANVFFETNVFRKAVTSTSPTTNYPAQNEFVVAGWVKSQLTNNIRTVTTEASLTPSTVQFVLNESQNAFRIWTGEQPSSEAYFDCYVSTNGGTAFPVRLYRWQGRIINASTNATVSLGTSNGRTLMVSGMTVPSVLEVPSGVTNYANIDKAGPPLWSPTEPQITLPANNGAFCIVADGIDRTLFISEYDGVMWSPPRWVTITNYNTTVRATYRKVALAGYDGIPIKIVAPTGSQVGGLSHRMNIGSPIGTRQWNCTTVDEFQNAISNSVGGDAIVLSEGTYSLTINVANGNFASNGSPWGITIRGATGNRDAVIISTSATNAGDWTLQGNSVTNLSALFLKDLTFNLTNHFGAITFNGGVARLDNVRVTGPTMTPTLASITLSTVSYNLDFLCIDSQVDSGSDDLISATGPGTNRPASKIRIVSSTAYRPGNATAAQCVTTHSGQVIEIYGGYYADANANVLANGDAATITYGFWPRVSNGPGTNSGASTGVAMFGGWFDFDDTTTIIPPTNSYWMFTRVARQAGISSSSCPGSLIAHNRFFKPPNSPSNFGINQSRSVGGTGVTVLGNILYGMAAAGYFNSGTEAVFTNKTLLLHNTFDSVETAFDLRASFLYLGLTNNACTGNTAGIANLAAAYMPYISTDFNTIDPSIDADFVPGANDIVNANAALDSNWFPTAGGNSDTNGAYLGYVGDSDPFGFVLIYSETKVPRGARARNAIFPGARLSPDFW